MAKKSKQAVQPLQKKVLEKELKPSKPGKVIVRKKKPFTQEKEMFGKEHSFFLNRMKKFKADGLVRQNMFGRELVWQEVKMHFSTSAARKSFKYFYIFALVKKDALKYLENHKIKKNSWLPAVHYNANVSIKKKEIIGTDIDTAYWNMAFKLGIICESTFEHGLSLPDKGLGLSALASLGSDKRYSIIRKGVVTNDTLVYQGDNRLKEVYKLIRYTCYQYMRQLSHMLGPGYVCYKTDCIYYINNQRNVELVKAFMEKYDLDYKMAKKFIPEEKPKKTD